MKFFLKFSIFYFVLVTASQLAFGEAGAFNPFAVVGAAHNQFAAIRGNATAIVLLLALNIWMGGLPRLKARYAQILIAMVANVLFITAFVIVKTSLTHIAGLWADPPFFADPFLAAADRALHFGVDPYRLTHAVADWAGSRWVDLTYGALWTTMTTLFPLIVAASDDDQPRIRDTMYLFIFVHIVLGNLLALAGMSAGPVYYDRLFGSDLFAGLATELHRTGLDHSFIGTVQNALWDAYANRLLAAGSGISAFPSVHVATATMVAVYFVSRSRWFTAPALLYVGAILFMSVHTGYHYAIDGYFAIGAVLAAWAILRRRRWISAPPETAPAE